MRLYKHKDYKEYLTAQIRKNIRKLDHRWVWGKEIGIISNHAKANILKINFGICHGSRNAYEVNKFRKELNADIIGTEISPTAKQFQHNIQWDFHNIKKEWINNVEFIYSNSLDHSFNPEHCIDCWMECLKKNGICYIHWGDSHNANKFDAADCFSATKDEYRTLFNKKYHVVDEINVEKIKQEQIQRRTIFAIKHGFINNNSGEK